jgi:hypothetical protein
MAAIPEARSQEERVFVARPDCGAEVIIAECIAKPILVCAPPTSLFGDGGMSEPLTVSRCLQHVRPSDFRRQPEIECESGWILDRYGNASRSRKRDRRI